MTDLDRQLIDHYELLYIIPGSLPEAEVPQNIAKVSALLAEFGAQVESQEELGLRKLAYKIKQEKQGFYVCVVFEMAKKMLPQLNAKLGLLPEVLRFLVIKTKKITAADKAQAAAVQEKIKAKKTEKIKKELAAQEATEAKEKEEIKKTPAPVAPPKDGKVSMEDLDKKLDEILDQNINL